MLLLKYFIKKTFISGIGSNNLSLKVEKAFSVAVTLMVGVTLKLRRANFYVRLIYTPKYVNITPWFTNYRTLFKEIHVLIFITESTTNKRFRRVSAGKKKKETCTLKEKATQEKRNLR